MPYLGDVRLRVVPGRSSSITIQESPTGDIVWLQLRKSAGIKAMLRAAKSEYRAGVLVVIDGLEQLSWMRRKRLIFQSYWYGMRLLVTAHSKENWIPTLLHTDVNFHQAKALLTGLIPTRTRMPTDEQLAGLLHKHDGNMREVLMDLYDDFQSRTTQRQEPMPERL